MKTLSLKLPEALDAKLAVAARSSGRTKSGVIRDLLEQALEGTEPGKGPSLYDLAKDLIVHADEGPTDLSWNKRHLEGYGR